MDMVAIGRVVLTSREHIIALDPLEKGLMGTLLRYPYEVRDEKEYFDEIQDVKVTKDMLDLAKHIVSQKSGEFDPERFEDHYEEALTELINAKRNGKTIAAKPRPHGENVIDLMDALKRSISGDTTTKAKKPRKASAGPKEMLLPIADKKTRKEAAKKTAKPQRRSPDAVIFNNFQCFPKFTADGSPIPGAYSADDGSTCDF
jgi:DNA end-binding protein Ku